MKELEKDEKTTFIKALFLQASNFIRNGQQITGSIEDVQTFYIEKGDFLNGKYKFTGIARICIDSLSQLYDYEGYANENEIIESINIKQSH